MLKIMVQEYDFTGVTKVKADKVTIRKMRQTIDRVLDGRSPMGAGGKLSSRVAFPAIVAQARSVANMGLSVDRSYGDNLFGGLDAELGAISLVRLVAQKAERQGRTQLAQEFNGYLTRLTQISSQVETLSNKTNGLIPSYSGLYNSILAIINSSNNQNINPNLFIDSYFNQNINIDIPSRLN